MKNLKEFVDVLEGNGLSKENASAIIKEIAKVSYKGGQKSMLSLVDREIVMLSFKQWFKSNFN